MHTLLVPALCGFHTMAISFSVLILPLVLPMQGGRPFNTGIQAADFAGRCGLDLSTSSAQVRGDPALPHRQRKR